VADLKTGFMQMAGDLPEPWDAWQLRWLVLAIIAAIRPTSLSLASIKVAWFVPDDLGCLEIKEAHRPFTVEDLETFRAQLAELCQIIQQQAGSVWREGPWCARCPGFSMCQLKRGVLEKLGINLEGPITAKSIVELSRLKQTAKKLLEQADDIELRWIQSNGQLPTRPGYALGLQTTRRKSLAPDAIELAKLVVAKPPIKQALDLAAFNDLPPDEYKATMVKLLEVGAIGISTSQHVREMRVKE
jgi:hypothetical protein